MTRTVCDRCGRIFAPCQEVNLKEKYWRLSVLYDCYPYEEEKIDLCPFCQKELLKWLKLDD